MKIAYQAHEGQVDACGIPYIFHPFHLAEQMTDEATTCAALLHDVAEDTDVTLADLSKEFPKDIIANVWNWDKNWKVEWLENGKVMGTMTQYTGVDPYAHQVCTDKKRTMQSWISAASTGHMFRATPRNPKAKIEIRVTDRFGKVYQQNVSK